jgi:hypothetical protein
MHATSAIPSARSTACPASRAGGGLLDLNGAGYPGCPWQRLSRWAAWRCSIRSARRPASWPWPRRRSTRPSWHLRARGFPRLPGTAGRRTISHPGHRGRRRAGEVWPMTPISAARGYRDRSRRWLAGRRAGAGHAAHPGGWLGGGLETRGGGLRAGFAMPAPSSAPRVASAQIVVIELLLPATARPGAQERPTPPATASGGRPAAAKRVRRRIAPRLTRRSRVGALLRSARCASPCSPRQRPRLEASAAVGRRSRSGSSVTSSATGRAGRGRGTA